jgi:dUTPase
MVLLFNFGDAPFNVARGDRIAQLVLEKICMAELEELPTLDRTDRGDGGFGSTGKD